MAVKKFVHDIDQVKVSQLLNSRTHNVTTSERTTLAGTLSTANKGLHVWDTDLSQTFYWNGTAFVQGIASVTGAMVYVGAHTSLTTAPAAPAQGYVYVFTGTAGTLTWAGETFSPSAAVEVGDSIIYRGSNVWDIYQKNDIEATDASLGNIQLATQAEVNAGTQATHAVTPATLRAANLARTYFAGSVTLVADTPFTVTHSLALQDRDAFILSIKDSTNSEISVDVDSVDVDSLTVTSSIAMTGVKITVIGD